ncbi:MAG: Hsp70 family protein [Thermotaleaceae bacterium]
MTKKSKTNRYIGIDFGSSKTVLAYIEQKNGIGLDIQQPNYISFSHINNTVPTYIAILEEYFDKKRSKASNSLFGWKADNPKYYSFLKHTFKMDLSEASKREDALRLCEKFFKYLRDEYIRNTSQHEEVYEFTYITYGAGYPPQMIQDILMSAKKAGFQNIKGLLHPAVLFDGVMKFNGDISKQLRKEFCVEDEVNLLSMDMGAGMADISVVKCVIREEEIVYFPLSSIDMDQGKSFGGNEIDKKLVKHYKKYFIESGIQKDDLQDFDSFAVEKEIKKWKENLLSPHLMSGNGEKFNGLPYQLQAVAKKFQCSIKNAELDRVRFEKYVIEEYIQKLSKAIRSTICSAGLTGKDIDFVLCTGGNSQWYFIKKIIEDKIPNNTPLELSRIKQESWRFYNPIHDDELILKGVFSYHQPFKMNKRNRDKIILGIASHDNTMLKYAIKTDKGTLLPAQWNTTFKTTVKAIVGENITFIIYPAKIHKNGSIHYYNGIEVDIPIKSTVVLKDFFRYLIKQEATPGDEYSAEIEITLTNYMDEYGDWSAWGKVSTPLASKEVEIFMNKSNDKNNVPI